MEDRTTRMMRSAEISLAAALAQKDAKAAAALLRSAARYIEGAADAEGEEPGAGGPRVRAKPARG